MLVDELRGLTNNSKQYQEEYEDIVKKIKRSGFRWVKRNESYGWYK